MKSPKWCFECSGKSPAKVRPVEYSVFIRKEHYQLLPNSAVIDDRRIGLCGECKETKNSFQKEHAIKIDSGDVDVYSVKYAC